MEALKETLVNLFVMGLCAPAVLLLVVMAIGQYMATH
jgi:hypothetical protein